MKLSEIAIEGKSSYIMVLPKLLKFASTFFNCPSLEGIPLENYGGINGSHWEDTYFRDELMSGVDRISKVISNFSKIIRFNRMVYS